MKIALFGYGKMGKLVEQIAQERGHEIVAIINKANQTANIEKADVCIDFSSPHSVISHLSLAAQKKKPIVIGTTGWLDSLPTVKEMSEKSKIGVIYAPNFSIGAHLFFHMIAHASRLVDAFDEYDVSGFEQHHNQKVDSPSGTALVLGEILLKELKRKNSIVWEPLQRSLKKEEIHFTSLRSGHTPGTHTIIFDSEADSLTLSHQARDRRGFALGAVKAAEWIKNRVGFFTIDDLLGIK